jgi:hypothetical protein
MVFNYGLNERLITVLKGPTDVHTDVGDAVLSRADLGHERVSVTSIDHAHFSQASRRQFNTWKLTACVPVASCLLLMGRRVLWAPQLSYFDPSNRS